MFLDSSHPAPLEVTPKYSGTAPEVSAADALAAVDKGRAQAGKGPWAPRPALRVLSQFEKPGRDLVFRDYEQLDRFIQESMTWYTGAELGPDSSQQALIRPPTGESLYTQPVEFGLTPELLDMILAYLTSGELLTARQIGKRWGEPVTQQARRRIPYPDFTIFAMLNHVLFPEIFSKGKFTDKETGKKQNLQLSWQQYEATLAGQQSLALVMRIFESEAFRRIRKAQVTGLEEDQVLFKPAVGQWTPQVDDSWILAHVHKRSCILLMCNPADPNNFWDSRKSRITATGREILIALRHGYGLFEHRQSPGEAIAGGLLLVPPDRNFPDLGILPASTTEIDRKALVSMFPRSVTPENMLTVEGIDFLGQVENSLEDNIADEIKSAKVCFTKLIPAFRQNQDPAFKTTATARTRCLNALTPDSHKIPYDRQDKYRQVMRNWVDTELDRKGLIAKNRPKEDGPRMEAFNETGHEHFRRG